MKPITEIPARNWLCAVVFAVIVTAPTGCAKPSESVAKNVAAQKPATGTTAARGVMRAGARNHRQAAAR